jgi:glycine cleavage system H lipoate-binding protein
MVSPTEGEVIEINSERQQNPAALRKDPHGNGWTVAAHLPDEESTRNLTPKGSRVDARSGRGPKLAL